MNTDFPPCVTCGGPRIKRTRLGLVGECDECGWATESERGVRRSVGLIGGAGVNKSAAISIFREPSPVIAGLVRRINCGCSPAASVPLYSADRTAESLARVEEDL